MRPYTDLASRSVLCPTIARQCCPPSYDCFPSKCCPAGQQPCGSTNLYCYKPSLEYCCPDGSPCPLGYDCFGNAKCCPSGQQPCGNTKCYDPNTQDCCTAPGLAWGCPKEYSCGAGGDCDLETPPPERPCDISYARGCEVINAPNPIRFRYTPRKITGKDGKPYDIANRAVMQNMCLGIRNYLGYYSQSLVLTRTDDKTRKENRRNMCPDRFCAKAWKQYIKKYHENGIPPKVRDAITMAQDMSCDEFPFAISAEGGKPGKGVGEGIRFCIPAGENSWQGGVMSSSFQKMTDMKAGKKFTVIIEGFDCVKMAPTSQPKSLMSRDVNETHVGAGEYGLVTAHVEKHSNCAPSDSLWRSYDQSDPTQNLITLPIGDLSAGTHEVDVNVTGSDDLNLKVLTYDGREFGADMADGKVTFTLDDDEDAVSIVGITTRDTGFEVVYQSRQVVERRKGTAGRTAIAGVGSLVIIAHLIISAVRSA